MPTYNGKKNDLKVMSNKSGNMTFKILDHDGEPVAGLVTLSPTEAKSLFDQMATHLKLDAASVKKENALAKKALEQLGALAKELDAASGDIYQEVVDYIDNAIGVLEDF